ncbi:MAG TPA: single-stranded DNA-binding protein [Acidimicrobiales bacterium]|nr:single-stranded DNA-binding protein [Acidimicrobiales bacterium]
MLNLAVVQGRLSRAPEERVLPSGDRLVSLELSVLGTHQPTESVPVAWPKAPSNITMLEPGTHVLVRGRVRRRFFRAAGFTQSRTEVVAEVVVPVRHARKVAKLLDQAAERLQLTGA